MTVVRLVWPDCLGRDPFMVAPPDPRCLGCDDGEVRVAGVEHRDETPQNARIATEFDAGRGETLRRQCTESRGLEALVVWWSGSRRRRPSEVATL